MKENLLNEKIKRTFHEYMKEAKGHAEKSITGYKKAIYLYEDCFAKEDFTKFNTKKAIHVKDWLKTKVFRGNTISLSTINTYLRYLRKFFAWLATQNRFKNNITPDQVEYLQLSDKERRIANQIKLRKYPDLDYVIKLTESIPIHSEVDMRDKALISFALITGMRDKAIITLPICCFDEKAGIVYQNPQKGVETKFSKNVTTVIFGFDQKLVDNVVEWIKYLKSSKNFQDNDPLFPRCKKEQNSDNLSFVASVEVEPTFISGTNSITEIFKNRTHNAGLEYFPPHTFRHLAIDLALKHCRTGEEIKAISQSFGHEHVTTTLSAYSNFDTQRLTKVLRNINFTNEPLAPNSTADNKKLEEIKKILLDQ